MNDQEMVEGVVRKALGAMIRAEQDGKPCPKCGGEMRDCPRWQGDTRDWACPKCGHTEEVEVAPLH